MEKRMNLLSLTWPIFIENVLFMLLGFIDIFVLSRYNDIAASAVSAANQVISICNLVFSIISGATAILISQSLGAQKRQTASMIAALSLVFSSIIGIVISALIALFHRPLLAALGAQGQILEYGCEYLLIVGGFIFTQAILNSVTAILRSHGYTKTSMYVTAIMNILNAVLDTAFVLGLFGLPSLGVRGVAIATTLARVAGICILCFCCSKGWNPQASLLCLNLFQNRKLKRSCWWVFLLPLKRSTITLLSWSLLPLSFTFYRTTILLRKPIFPTSSSSFISFPTRLHRQHRFWSATTSATGTPTLPIASACIR